MHLRQYRAKIAIQYRNRIACLISSAQPIFTSAAKIPPEGASGTHGPPVNQPPKILGTIDGSTPTNHSGIPLNQQQPNYSQPHIAVELTAENLENSQFANNSQMSMQDEEMADSE